jgi:hypothetical protein
VQVYIDACLRHVYDFYNGEDCAPDSKVKHLAHAIACLNIIIDAETVGLLVDDRPTPAPVSEILEELRVK